MNRSHAGAVERAESGTDPGDRFPVRRARLPAGRPKTKTYEETRWCTNGPVTRHSPQTWSTWHGW
ncbi:hypothetical protein GCM10010284_59170 [Streptomyces rubiginosohelvolus]|uniref:Uncharacterized protein n=1 Tax=Streptomyces rubiginosohelvolus TaxID=67362 RepID=A0ABQ3C163_9ACTN|nr:hypothetical protein GCM10010284_59170 [Streptomyces rubiginosohelvolus]GGZ61323.1 hypothetical protein GCM10010328_39820 [Streptomyces pluricolorescens]